MKPNILNIIYSLKKQWWAENSCINISNKLFDKWYKIEYITFLKENIELKYKWQRVTLNEKNYKWSYLLKLFIRAYKIKKNV